MGTVLYDTAWWNKQQVYILVHKECFDRASQYAYDKRDPDRFKPITNPDRLIDKHCDFCGLPVEGQPT